jgi:CheY-like chemotaxis protein
MACILIVDDDQQVRELLSTLLTRKGFEIAEALNGREAIEYCNSRIPDLVLTDIIMPEKEGLSTIRELKAKYPSLKIIAISGGGGNRGEAGDLLEKAKELGVTHGISKPFDLNVIISTIRVVLES